MAAPRLLRDGPGRHRCQDRALASGRTVNLFGIPVITSPYVPKWECSEVDYSRPLIVRLFHGRMTDFRYWEEDQMFIMGVDWASGPDRTVVVRGLG